MSLSTCCYKLSLSILVFIFPLPASCQTPVIKKSYAYYYQTTMGALPKAGTDDIEFVHTDSNAVINNKKAKVAAKKDTTIVVYIVTKFKNIIWEAASQNNQQLTVIALPIETIPCRAGFSKDGGEITIKPAKGYLLFELQFLNAEKKVSTHAKVTVAPILLKGKCKQKTFSYKTAALKEIIPLPPT